MIIIKKLVDRIIRYRESSSFIFLVFHFLRRLFINETVFLEEQMIGKIITIIAILSIFPSYVAEALFFKYLLEPEKGTAWAEMALFMTISMILIALVTLFEWEIIYLDKKDYLNLMPLPIKIGTIFLAKFISLVVFVGLFAAGINSISSLVIAIYLSQSKPVGLISGLHIFIAYMVSIITACLFIFFSIALILGLFNSILRSKIFRLLANLIRLALVSTSITLIYLFIFNPEFILAPYEQFLLLKNSPNSFMLNFPPLWFASLYEVILGSKDPFFHHLAIKGLLSLLLIIGLFWLLATVSFCGYGKKLSVEENKKFRPFGFKKILEFLLNRTILKSSIEKAFFWFFYFTLSRSRLHRNRLFSYIGLGAGLSFVLFLSAGKWRWGLMSPEMLSVPLVFSFFLVIGTKHIINLPSHYDANWIFKLIESPNKWPIYLALRKWIYLIILIPIFLFFFFFYSFFWELPKAAFHCLYTYMFAVMLTEILLFKYRKFPFACSYLPGKSKLHIFWLPYLFLFLAYIFLPKWVESYFLKRPFWFISFCICFTTIICLFWSYHKFYYYRKLQLIYDEEPEPLIIELVPLFERNTHFK